MSSETYKPKDDSSKPPEPSTEHTQSGPMPPGDYSQQQQPYATNQQPYHPIPNQPTGDQADPKSRLAMILLAYFAMPTGIARAYIGEKSGMVRFWIYIASLVLSIVPFINILAGLSTSVLSIWGLIDFFILRGRRVDAFNQPLYSTNRDERYINYVFIFFIISMVLVALILLVFVVIIIATGVSIGNSLDALNGIDTSTLDQNYGY